MKRPSAPFIINNIAVVTTSWRRTVIVPAFNNSSRLTGFASY